MISKDGGIFLHDIGWSCGRCDLYYSPDQTPGEYCHPYANKGIIEGQFGLADEGVINSDLRNAVMVGGSRNGVLIAIEDFIKKPGLELEDS
ncbi:MAG: hypothetical protein ACFFD4_31120 [Candidatus Odinarchaeota archaeon]